MGVKGGSGGRERQREGESREVEASHDHMERGERGGEPKRGKREAESERGKREIRRAEMFFPLLFSNNCVNPFWSIAFLSSQVSTLSSPGLFLSILYTLYFIFYKFT